MYPCPAMGGFPALANEPPSQRPGYQRPPVDTDDRSWWPHDRAISQLYGRLDRHVAEQLAQRLRPQPRSVFRLPYPLTRPPNVPTAFLYTRDDELFDDDWSRWIYRTMFGIDAIELPGGHFPMLEHSMMLASTLERVSGAAR